MGELIELGGVRVDAVRARLAEESLRSVSFGDGTGRWSSIDALRDGQHYGATGGVLAYLVETGEAEKHPVGQAWRPRGAR